MGMLSIKATDGRRSGSIAAAVRKAAGLTLALAVLVAAMLGAGLALAAPGDYTVDTAWPATGIALSTPMGVAVDSAGDVVVGEALGQRIKKITAAGSLAAGWSSGVSTVPRGVAVDDAGNVYAADPGKDQILKFSPTGALLAAFGTLGTGPGQFTDPFGVTVDGSGNIYVADTSNHRIQKLSNTGAHLATWGSQGNLAGQFSFPYDVALDAAGNLYVIEGGNNRIQKLSSTGTTLNLWSSGLGFFSPRGIVVDGAGTIFVADTLNHKIKKISSTGTLLVTWGANGTEPGQLRNPYGIAVDSIGRVYVADSGNNRVQRFYSDTTPPVISDAPADMTVEATGSDGAVVTYGATASDLIDGEVAVVFEPTSGSTFAIGTTTVVYSATDKAGNRATGSFKVTVEPLPAPPAPTTTTTEVPETTTTTVAPEPTTTTTATEAPEPPSTTTTTESPATGMASWVWSGLLQPVNADGSSVFKLGSTVPLKFTLVDGSGAVVADATATLGVAKVTNQIVGSESEAVSSTPASAGNLFRFDAATGQYIYNYGTKGLSEGTFQIRIDLGDGVERTVRFSLKR
jgi:hypothetical protein